VETHFWWELTSAANTRATPKNANNPIPTETNLCVRRRVLVLEHQARVISSQTIFVLNHRETIIDRCILNPITKVLAETPSDHQVKARRLVQAMDQNSHLCN